MAIIDTTLREGEQSPGVLFDFVGKEKIIAGLIRLGVDEIELGVVAQKNKGLGQLCEVMHGDYPSQQFSLWCRCLDSDIRLAAKYKPSVLALSLPVSDLHITKKLGKTRSFIRRQLEMGVSTALKLGIKNVAVGLEDATRANLDFVREVAVLAAQAGAFRVRLADTVGVATPTEMVELVQLVADLDLEIGVHCHNDFGMATANSISGLTAGAKWADVTILGLGERAGNSRLEEVVAYLVLKAQCEKYDLSQLAPLAKLVSEMTGQSIHHQRPIVGGGIFKCETGLHLQGIMADPETYEPFSPNSIGAERSLLIGCKVGNHAVANTLKRLGLACLDKEGLTALTQRIRNVAWRKKGFLTDLEIISLRQLDRSV